MKFEEDGGKNLWTVVGIVADARFFGWDHDNGIVTYFPYRALGRQPHFAITARTAGDPSSYSAAMKKAVWSIDPDLPLLNVQTMQWRLNRAFAPRRFNAFLLAAFAGVALTLACIGIFGLISYIVAQKTREIGIRMALGATRATILRFVLKRAIGLALIGIGFGLPCSYLAAILLRSLLYQTMPFDVPVFMGTTLVC